MIQKAKILIFCMIFVVGGVFGQNALDNFGFKQIEIPNYFAGNCFSGPRKTTMKIMILTNLKTYKEPIYYSSSKIAARYLFPISSQQSLVVIAPDYYTQNFGFFCKKELQLQKAIKVPFVFRLGSVEMCDGLERKGR